MKYSFTSILLMITLSVFSQRPFFKDSLFQAHMRMGEIQKRYLDSMRSDPEYIELTKRINAANIESDGYFGMSIYATVHSVNFNRLNSDNAQSNFGEMRGPAIGIGIGWTGKRKRRIFEFNFGAFGLNNSVKKSDEKITANFSTILQFEWGYNLLKSTKWNVYPFAGFGFRSTSLNYEHTLITNPSFTNISNMVQVNNEVTAHTLEFGYQAGFGLEYMVKNDKESGWMIVVLKAGTNRPVSKQALRFENLRYNPNLRYGDLTMSIGIKLVGRAGVMR